MQRCDAASASETDREEAVQLGKAAVREALENKSEVMITIRRAEGKGYKAVYGTESIRRIAEKDNTLPAKYIASGGNNIRNSYLAYIEPLIGDLPEYAEIGKH